MHAYAYFFNCDVCIITGGDDYAPGPFSVTIPAGETSVPFNISIIDDNIFEANELFTLTIDSSSLSSRVLVQPGCMAIITIVDNEGELIMYKVLIIGCCVHIYIYIYVYEITYVSLYYVCTYVCT